MDMTEEAMEQLRYGLSRSGPLQEALDHALKELDGCVFCCYFFVFLLFCFRVRSHRNNSKYRTAPLTRPTHS